MTEISNRRYAIGVDIGGSHICSALVDLVEGCLCTSVVTTPVDSQAGAAKILSAWSTNLRQTLDASTVGAISQIGFAFPGPFDYVHGISLIQGVQKFDKIYGLDVSVSLQACLPGGRFDLRFVNDASAFALGESLGGAARDVERVVALTLGTGVGSGFVADHQLVESGDSVPAKGWVYCLPFEEGIVDEAFSTRWFCKRHLQLTGEKIGEVRELIDRYPTDPLVRQLFAEYGQRLAAFAGPVLERFGAKTLLLGGNIARSYPLFSAALTQQLAAEGRRVEIRISTLLDQAAMIGAASLFL